MAASTTLVNVAEDAELRLVSLLAESSASGDSLVSACQACIESGDAAQLLRTILSDSSALSALLELPTDAAVSATSLLAALLERVSNDDTRLKLATQLATRIADAATGDTNRKLVLLSVLYNMQSNETEKCHLLQRLFELAGTQPEPHLTPESTLGQLLQCPQDDNSSDLLNTCPSPRIVTLLDSWTDLNVADRRNLYRTIVTATKSLVDKNTTQRFLLLLIESYKTSDGLDAAAKQAAQEAAIGTIRDPISMFYCQRGLLQQPAVAALAQNPATKDVYALLKIVQEGTLSDYLDFVQQHGGPNVLTQWGLDADTCKRNMQILSLVSLAAQREQLPYTDICTALQLDSVDGVEGWVIQAVSSGLLQAKMDQLAQTVLVERSVVRKMDAEQWKMLQQRLQVWKSNVGSILETLKQSQQQQHQQAAANM